MIDVLRTTLDVGGFGLDSTQPGTSREGFLGKPRSSLFSARSNILTIRGARYRFLPSNSYLQITDSGERAHAATPLQQPRLAESDFEGSIAALRDGGYNPVFSSAIEYLHDARITQCSPDSRRRV
jgi:hypothetical protein